MQFRPLYTQCKLSLSHLLSTACEKHPGVIGSSGLTEVSNDPGCTAADPRSRVGVSYPGRKIPLGSQDALGGELPLVLQEIHGRLESPRFALPNVLPSHVEHEAEEHHADAAAVVAGQVDGQQGAQAFAEGPQHADGALPGRLARRTGSHERRASARGGLCKGGGHRDGLNFVRLHWLDPDIRFPNCGTERRPPPRTPRRGVRGTMKEELVTADRRLSVSRTK